MWNFFEGEEPSPQLRRALAAGRKQTAEGSDPAALVVDADSGALLWPHWEPAGDAPVAPADHADRR